MLQSQQQYFMPLRGCQPSCANLSVHADAPATCKSFFKDTTAPFCLRVTGTWTSPEELVSDSEFLSPECQAAVSTACEDAAAPTFTNMRWPECADEASASYLATMSYTSATVESECTKGVRMGVGSLHWEFALGVHAKLYFCMDSECIHFERVVECGLAFLICVWLSRFPASVSVHLCMPTRRVSL